VLATVSAQPQVITAAATAAASATPSGRPALPKVATFDLPAGELARIAEQAGLQWVNSDAERVAAVRAAIDAEPRPIHVPRERPAQVVLDDGPLVLVETRKDLATLTLPFESQPGAAAS
jgi:ribonuclease E